MTNEGTTPESGGTPPAPAGDQAREVLLKTALNAFKKRYKLTKLDQESKLGASRPMTAGKKAEGIGINPPREFDRDVWQELAKQGKIKDMGGGFYSM